MSAEFVRDALAFAASVPFHLVPRPIRFRVVLRTARILTPLIGPLLLGRYGNVMGGAADETARVCFRALARMRLPLDSAFVADMGEDVLAMLERGPAIFVTGHFPMNPIFTRWLLDHGHRPVLLRESHVGEPTIWGTPAVPEYLHPGPRVLLDVRRMLRNGRAILLAIDGARPGVRSIEVHSRFGMTSVATPVFAFAKALRVPLFFFGARLTATGFPVVTVRRIPYDPQAFVDALHRHAERMLPEM